MRALPGCYGSLDLRNKAKELQQQGVNLTIILKQKMTALPPGMQTIKTCLELDGIGAVLAAGHQHTGQSSARCH